MAVQPAALPGLRDTYTQALNVFIRKELRLFSSSLRKAATAALDSGTPEPDMGLAHKKVSFSFTKIALSLALHP